MTDEERLKAMEQRLDYVESQLALLTDFLATGGEDIILEEITVN